MATTATIPIIDISADGVNQEQVAKELVDAAVEYGFVYIKNAGREISIKQIENAFNVSRILFKSPPEDKQRCKIEKNNQGWSGMHTETLDPKTQRVGDFKEGFNFGPFANGKATQPIPQSIEPYQEQLSAFREACHELCRKLLLLFGIGLGVNPPSFFTTAHSPTAPSGSILRFLYYPPPSSTPDASPDDVRAGAHSDYGSVTLLFRLRGQAGLEILNPTTSTSTSESWSPVPVSPPGTSTDPSPPILVNIGDLLSYWTGGLLRSTVHRVAFSPDPNMIAPGETATEPRYSVVYFCHPANDTPLAPVPSERVKAAAMAKINGGSNSNPYAEPKVLTALEHLQMRLRATYLQMYGDDGKAERK
ncbi:2OG-Fe(II) oxygenase superfamily protein [Hypoxylon trugodes]|uniref:2OG-Fe(II) oxygenase superfamily protein n=1 Tax=Hypoxylon trugodes TaxID=326681 RepID=UPI00218D9674|nr:2OG-Fe(II) oxygenase superfamily protein [Hypoxylon trugodes]KAI1390971.1 2OG-Fe(II) oxygenase superfamily protein [Hypoxylon trugodes]